MIKEIEAKTILTYRKNPGQWFGVNYNMNIYRGCQHGCIYCDSRSDCYRVDNFDSDITVKINAIELLEKALAKKYKRATIGTGAMSDPYMPIEMKYELTKSALEVIEKYRFRVSLATKSHLVLRDIMLLEKIAKRYACVAMTITTVDEQLANIIEPGAPTPKQRMEAIGILREIGVDVGILMQPQLPFIMESTEHVDDLVDMAYKYGAKFIYPAFGMTMRDGQREYYYEKLDEEAQFQHLSALYKKKFKNYYQASCVHYKTMRGHFNRRCREYGIHVGQTSYERHFGHAQLNLFDLE